ncbi:MAG: type II toxin-antitoxin system VapC family toxin [Candidatus Nanopelagicales bacterium]
MLDTNVVSELMRGRAADENVRNWITGVHQTQRIATAITVAEILYGIERLPPGRRKEKLSDAASVIFFEFSETIASFDLLAAQAYAGVVDSRARAGAPISGFDAQIAAICLSGKHTLATRNTKDFEALGIDLVNPWLSETNPS